MAKAIVEVDHLRKVYPSAQKGELEFVAVDDLSFKIYEGEVLGLLGPNGAGKSTTISMLLGVLTPTGGNISYFGKDFTSYRSEIMNHVTFSSTYIKMPWRLSVIENLRVYGYMYGLSKKQFDKRVEKFLSKFGVWDQRNKTMNSLSAGQVTRVMLAKAFIPHPKVVLLDEPTASLDPDIAHQIRGFVREQQQEFNTTLLYTSHNMDEVADLCDRVMFLKQGKIIAVDTPENLVKTMRDLVLFLHFKTAKTDIAEELAQFGQIISFKDRVVEMKLPEDQVTHLLQHLAKIDMSYTQISINKPNLEDYFLAMAK